MKKPMVAMMQPTFLPWVGYFAMIEMVDVFIFLDDFQFSRQSYQQRNRLFVSESKVGWVTLPTTHTKGSSMGVKDVSLLEARPAIDDKFLARFRGILESNYKKSDYYADMREFIEEWLSIEWASLAEINMHFIRRVAELLRIEVEYVNSSELPVDGRKSERVVEILRATGAKSYLSAQGAFGYMKSEDIFPIDDIEVGFLNFDMQPYRQRQSDVFVTSLSVLDGLLQIGPEAMREIVCSGIQAPKTWDEMTALQV
jgi:WbqC-like protein family